MSTENTGTPSPASLYATDPAALALGIRITALAADSCTVHMVVRADMVNSHGSCHGGIIFALADSAAGFNCNYGGRRAVAANANIDFLSPAFAGDELTATTTLRWRLGRGDVYDVAVTNQGGQAIALLRGRSRLVSERGRDNPDTP